MEKTKDSSDLKSKYSKIEKLTGLFKCYNTAKRKIMDELKKMEIHTATGGSTGSQAIDALLRTKSLNISSINENDEITKYIKDIIIVKEIETYLKGHRGQWLILSYEDVAPYKGDEPYTLEEFVVYEFGKIPTDWPLIIERNGKLNIAVEGHAYKASDYWMEYRAVDNTLLYERIYRIITTRKGEIGTSEIDQKEEFEEWFNNLKKEDAKKTSQEPKESKRFKKIINCLERFTHI